MLHEVDDHEVHRQLAAPGVRLLVITSPFCGACRALHQVLGALPPGLVDQILVADAGASPGLVADLEVFHLPALFLYRDGAFHRPVSAPPRLEPLIAAIAAAKAAPAAQEPGELE